MDDFRQKVLSTVKIHFPEIMIDIQSLPDEVWNVYKQEIDQYISGCWRSEGWYLSIYWQLQDTAANGMSDELAHALSHIREYLA